MTPTPDDDPVLGLVRRHLLAESAGVDAAPLYERIRGTTSPKPAAPPRWRRWTAGALAFSVALAVGFAGGLALAPGPVRASAEILVKEAQEVHAQPLDRCYLVESRPEPGFHEKNYPRLAQPRVSRLWTRGDRFWVESAEPHRQWAWGRDDEGNFWMTVGRTRGVRFERKELPPPLAVACDVYGMQVESLLGDVLRHFDLSREPGDDGSVIVRATPRPGRPVPGLRGATLTLDAETKVVRKAELYRTVFGRPAATVTFTLADSKAQDDKLYSPEGHLSPPYEMLTAEVDAQRRTEFLRGFFPRVLDGPFPSPKGLPPKGFPRSKPSEKQ